MKTPSAGKLAGMLKNCRQDLERQGQQTHNLMTRILHLAAENAALRHVLGDASPPAPPPAPPLIDMMHILSRRQQAAYDLGMDRPLSSEQANALLADLDALTHALLESL